MKTKRMTFLALCISILVVQEYALSFVPFIQFSVLLMIAYNRNFSFKEMLILHLCYIFLDNLLLGGLNLIYMIPMFLGWFLLTLSLQTIFKKINNELTLAIIGATFGLVYSWIFVVFQLFILDTDALIGYIIADIPFEIGLSVSSFLTIIWLYKPINRFFNNLSSNHFFRQS